MTTSAGTNSANITVWGVEQLSDSTGNILLADAGSTANLVLDGETVTGNIFAKDASSVSASLLNGTVLTGASIHSAISLDSTSTLVLAANSEVTALAGAGRHSISTPRNHLVSPP